MKDLNKKIALTRYDDLFVSSDQPNVTSVEMISSIPLDQLHPFANHPFKLYTEEKMREMVESIAKYGVLTPILVRPQANGEGYEVVSGQVAEHRCVDSPCSILQCSSIYCSVEISLVCSLIFNS